MLIGILQTGHTPDQLRPQAGDYPDLFTRMLAPFGFSFRSWDVTAMEMPDSPDVADGWLITGSRHGTYDDLPWIAPLEAFVRQIHVAEAPLVGICFGHQIVAQALGGQVEKFAGGWSVGATAYQFSDGPFGSGTRTLNAWHQDQVVVPPEGARTIARGPNCAHAAFAIGRHILTVQPHPEFGAGFVEGLLEHRSATVPDPLKAEVRARLDTPTDNEEVAAALAAFFREGARARAEPHGGQGDGPSDGQGGGPSDGKGDGASHVA